MLIITYSFQYLFGTLEEYCRQRWGFQRNYANKLIASAKVSENLGTVVPKTITESQLRPLTHLEPEQQKEVWKKAVETAPEGKPGDMKICFQLERFCRQPRASFDHANSPPLTIKEIQTNHILFHTSSSNTSSSLLTISALSFNMSPK